MHYRLGLALSGGGARGLSHIGFLKVLEREGIHIHSIAGTSMGSVVAAAFARGMPLAELEQEALSAANMRSMMGMVTLTGANRGLVDPVKVKTVLSRFIPEDLRFESTHIPLAVCATDLLTAAPVTLNEGPILPAVIASCSVPGMFPPVDLHPYRLVDGGVLNNLPVDLVRDMGADRVIAVDVQANPFLTTAVNREDQKQNNSIKLPLHFPLALKDIFLSASIMIAYMTGERLKAAPADLYLRPAIPPEINMFTGFNRARDLIAVGQALAEESLPAIREMIGR